MNIDRLNLDRNSDGRYALSEDNELELREEAMSSKLNNRELAEKWNVSVYKVWAIRNPKKHEENKKRRNENYKGKYYDTAKAREYARNNRKKKRELLEKTTNNS